jgi:redox-sensitive bicupin YhaK (pirin superfamily)
MPAVDLLITPRPHDIGGLEVRRVLPYAKRRMVGPFIFLDHMGPADFTPGEGIDVRPHPHIGLATVTYLFEGEITHRDTLGSFQVIKPGAVNWMTAGRGIAHSERTGVDERGRSHALHGMQSWVALPKEHEETAPEFFHYAADIVPELPLPGVTLRVIAGEAYGVRSPVKIYSPLFYVEAVMEAGAELFLPEQYAERAAYVVEGYIDANGEPIGARNMGVFTQDKRVMLTANTAARVMLLGGEPFPEKRFIWWNFVSSSEARIDQAKADWQAGRFGTVPGDEKEFIPLPTP